MRYFGRDGKPMSMLEANTKPHSYRVVKQETLPNGLWVSTVWLGMDHGWGNGLPVIFETMVFPPGSMRDLDCSRYCTEEDALKGHAAMVKVWRHRPNKRIKKLVLKRAIRRGREDHRKMIRRMRNDLAYQRRALQYR